MTIAVKPEQKAGLYALGATIAALGALAFGNFYLALKAAKDNPPEGEFVAAQGVRLHFVARGEGPAVVLLHGNGSMLKDFECSGIFGALTSKYRVFAFDRPGYGHSSRPRAKSWTPVQQASLIAEALSKLGVNNPIIVGHSWGTLVAVALAKRQPSTVKGLVLLSGYYFPTPRVDVLIASIGAMPVIGDILRHTIWPVIGRIAWPLVIRNLFNPCKVPEKFRTFPKEMALRPSQLRASAEESALMVPSAIGLAEAYHGLKMPVAIVCGAGDKIVDPQQSKRVHKVLKNGTLKTLLFNGHMVHHTALDQVIEAIEDVAQRSA